MTETAEQMLDKQRKKPGRKPAKAITETPEFQAAVAAAAAEAVRGAMAQLQNTLGAATVSPAAAGVADLSNPRSLLEGLAIALAEIGNQGTGKKTVSPEIIRQRAEARQRMVDLIVKARSKGQVPVYQLRNKVLLAHRLIEPFWIDSNKRTQPTEIEWLGIPNEAMVPVNDVAKGIHAEFSNSIGTNEAPKPDQALGVTPNGVVVRNRAVTQTMARSGQSHGSLPPTEAQHVGDGGDPLSDGEGLSILHKDAPGRYKSVNVLGTIHEPARQSI